MEEFGTVGALGDDDGPVNLSISGGALVALPARVRRLSADAIEIVSDIQSLVSNRQELEDLIDRHVFAARELGVSWSIIAWSVGMTEAGAKRRYGES